MYKINPSDSPKKSQITSQIFPVASPLHRDNLDSTRNMLSNKEKNQK